MALPQFTPSKLRLMRERVFLTRKGFARRLGVSAITIQFWESGRRTPRADTWAKIIRFYNVTRKRIEKDNPHIRRLNMSALGPDNGKSGRYRGRGNRVRVKEDTLYNLAGFEKWEADHVFETEPWELKG